MMSRQLLMDRAVPDRDDEIPYNSEGCFSGNCCRVRGFADGRRLEHQQTLLTDDAAHHTTLGGLQTRPAVNTVTASDPLGGEAWMGGGAYAHASRKEGSYSSVPPGGDCGDACRGDLRSGRSEDRHNKRGNNNRDEAYYAKHDRWKKDDGYFFRKGH